VIGYIAICLVALVWALAVESPKIGRLTWREIKGVTRFLLSGPEPTPYCRACGKELPDPMLREPLGHGAFACEECNDKIELEVGLAYPSWWTEKALPPMENVVAPPETYICAACGDEHPRDHICLVELKKYVKNGPGDEVIDDWFKLPGGGGGSSQLACPEPRMNTVVTREGARLRALRANLEDMSDDDFMEFFKKQIP
jgi:DNA-directed RNA polymerase subunit RPC12/RpoP